MEFNVPQEEISTERKTRSTKKETDFSCLHNTLRQQTLQVVSGEKEMDDKDFIMLQLRFQPREQPIKLKLTKSQEFQEVLSSLVDFGASHHKSKKQTKKKAQGSELINPLTLLNIETKEALTEEIKSYCSKSKTFSALESKNYFCLKILEPGNEERESNYCNCFQIQENENFISCDECQVWYHCKCVGLDFETLNESDAFICQKCKNLKAIEGSQIGEKEIALFEKEHLKLDEIIILSVYLNSAIPSQPSPSSVLSLNTSPFSSQGGAEKRVAELAVASFFLERTLEEIQSFDLGSVFTKDNTIDNKELARLKSLVVNSRTVLHNLASFQDQPSWEGLNERLEVFGLALQMYEEIKPKYVRIPILIAIAKQFSQTPELKVLSVFRHFMGSLKTAKSRVESIKEDFQSYHRVLKEKMAQGDLLGAQNAKPMNSRLQEYKADLGEGSLACRIVDSMLNDLGLVEAEKTSEIPLKFDSFVVTLVKELKSVLRSGESDVTRVWHEKRSLFEKSKFLMQKVHKLKSELPQWKNIAELSNPEAVLATNEEVDRVILESEESVLFMNSAAIRKLSMLKTATSTFEKRNNGDYWSSYDSSKRHIFNIMKAGVLCNADVIKMIKELKNHGQITKFSNHRAFFNLPEIESILKKAEKRFEKEYYDTAELLIQEVKVFISKAEEIQDRHDLWSDRVLEELLNINQKLKDYKIILPDSLARFHSIAKAVGWLMDVAEQSGLDLPKKQGNSLLKYSFASTLETLLENESLFENMNIRTMIRLDRTHAPGVFPQHPDLFRLSCRSSKRIWQKDLEELLGGKGPFHMEDVKNLLRKWAAIDPGFESLPKELNQIVESFREFKQGCVEMVQNRAEFLTPDFIKIGQMRPELEKICSYNKISDFDESFDLAQNCAYIFLAFGLKLEKAHFYLNPEEFKEQVGQFEAEDISNINKLLLTTLSKCKEKEPQEICSSSSVKSLEKMIQKFSSRIKQGGELSILVESFISKGEKVIKKIASLRKDKAISLNTILEEIQQKPHISEAKKVIEQLGLFGLNSADEKRALIQRYLEECVDLENYLEKFVKETKIAHKNTPENKAKFEVFEKDFLRQLKKAELLPVYSPLFKVYFLSANSCYKIYKQYFEPASPKKWKKVKESIQETIKACPEVETILEEIGVLKHFQIQHKIIESLGFMLNKEKISIAEISEMLSLINPCKSEAIGNVDIRRLREDCQALEAVLQEIKAATPQARVSIEKIERCKKMLDSFDLLVDENETDFIYKAQERQRKLTRFLQSSQKEGVLPNGFLTDFVDAQYSVLAIQSKQSEELLTARINARNSYQNIEAAIWNLGDSSYLELEPKLSKIKPCWDLWTKQLQMMIWVRKVCDIKTGKYVVNLLTLECLIQEAVDLFEKSKKLIPSDQRTLCCVLQNKVSFLEELLNTSDKFLEELSKCTSIRELEEKVGQFGHQKQIDLSTTFIDMKTQLSMGSIEFIKPLRKSYTEAMKTVIGEAAPGEIGWDTLQDFNKLKQLFERLSSLDKEVLERRFFEMMEGAQFYQPKDPVNLALEGAVGAKDDSNLNKRKPLKPQVTAGGVSNLGAGSGVSAARRVEHNVGQNSDSMINTQSLSNLSNLHIDQDAITESFREWVTNQLIETLKENPYFGNDEDKLKTGAKNLEINLFSNDYKSKSLYQKSFLFLKSLFARLLAYENISKDVIKNNFSYDHIVQLKDKTEQKLFVLEKELKQHQSQGNKYHPLNMFSGDPESSTPQKNAPGGLLGALGMSSFNKLKSEPPKDASGKKNYLSEVLKDINAENAAKKNLAKALGPPKRKRSRKSSDEAKRSRSRSRSRSHSNDSRRRKHKRDRKKDRKEKKKKFNEKAKFSSESEDEDDEKSQENNGQGWEAFKNPSENIQTDERAIRREKDTVPVKLNPPGSWFKLNFVKGKVRIFFSEQKKTQNEGYSVLISLNTSESEETIQQFPDFTKVPTFVFDKYIKEVEDLELQYQKKLNHMKKHPQPGLTHTMMAGWVNVEGGEKEKKNIGHLENYLASKQSAISYMPSAGLTLYFVLGKNLKNETLRAINLKEKYDSGITVELDKKLFFFLKRSQSKEEPGSKRLTCSLVQAYEKNLEKTVKIIYGNRNEDNSGRELGRNDKRKEIHDRRDKSDLKDKDNTPHSEHFSVPSQPGVSFPMDPTSIDQSSAPLDATMLELVAICKELSPPEIEELIVTMTDQDLKEKFCNIIKIYLPHLKYILDKIEGNKNDETTEETAKIPNKIGEENLAGDEKSDKPIEKSNQPSNPIEPAMNAPPVGSFPGMLPAGPMINPMGYPPGGLPVGARPGLPAGAGYPIMMYPQMGPMGAKPNNPTMLPRPASGVGSGGFGTSSGAPSDQPPTATGLPLGAPFAPSPFMYPSMYGAPPMMAPGMKPLSGPPPMGYPMPMQGFIPRGGPPPPGKPDQGPSQPGGQSYPPPSQPN